MSNKEKGMHKAFLLGAGMMWILVLMTPYGHHMTADETMTRAVLWSLGVSVALYAVVWLAGWLIEHEIRVVPRSQHKPHTKEATRTHE